MLKRAGPLIKRIILMLGYGALCLMIGYLLAGSGHGAFEPTAFQLSWALVVYGMGLAGDLYEIRNREWPFARLKTATMMKRRRNGIRQHH